MFLRLLITLNTTESLCLGHAQNYLLTRIELKVLTTLRHNRMLGIIWIETQEYKFIQNVSGTCPLINF